MTLTFETRIEQYPFDKDGITLLKNNSEHGEDWPVVYILNGEKEAYVGETQSAYDRMIQHYAKKDSLRKNLTKINLMQNDSFNKSAILDIENMLITHMHADGKYILQNANGGQSKLHNYYQRSEYQNVFSNIWSELKKLNLVNHNLFEVENSEIFKFSPYKELTNEQYRIVENISQLYSKAIQGSSRMNVMIKGGAGTGKTLIAIYFINVIANILNNNYDFSNNDDYVDEESIFNKAELIKTIKKYGNNKIGFVVAVPSFKSTIKKVFSSIRELKQIHVISPSEASRGDYDVLIVDEAHRLKRRNKLTNYGSYDNINESLGLSQESTELDWLQSKAKKMLIMFYDDKQSVKESDVLRDDFKKIELSSNTYQFKLETQLRVKGGNEYIKFAQNILTDNPEKYKVKAGYEIKVYDDCYEMLKEIKKKNDEYKGLCRVLSGITFEYHKKINDKKDTKYSKDYDFEIDGHKYNWNEDFNDSSFITDDKNIDKIGCIYTSQGHDLNFAGVIFGEDITYNPVEKRIEYHVDKFLDKKSKSIDLNKTIENIKNAYLVLLTRGVYGTYIYAVDKNLRDHIKSLIEL